MVRGLLYPHRLPQLLTDGIFQWFKPFEKINVICFARTAPTMINTIHRYFYVYIELTIGGINNGWRSTYKANHLKQLSHQIA